MCIRDRALERFIGNQLRLGGGILAERGVVEAAEERNARAHLLQRENSGVEAVVQVLSLIHI